MTQIVQIPAPSSPQFGQSVKQWINVRDGAVGPAGLKPNRFVEVKDLYDPDFINALSAYKYPITRVNTDYGYTGDTSAPRPPTNLQIASEVFRNILTWNDPNSDNFWYIEVYRAKVPAGDAAPTVGNAIKIASVPKTVESFVDTEVSITSYDHYYWIRAVSYAGIASLWQDGYIEGHTTINATIDSIMTTLKGADPDAWSSIVDYVVDDRVLQGGKRYKCILANTNQVPPNATYWEQSGILITGNIGGVNTVGIDGNLVVDDTILARCINVDDAFIGMTIQSTVYDPGVSGWQINANGDVEFNSGVFRGATVWTAITGLGKPDDNADVTGDNMAAAIVNLPATLAGAGLYADATHLGYYDGAAWQAYIGSDGKFYFKGDANNYIQWDGTAFTVKGLASVESLGAINADLGTITAGNITLDSSGFIRTSGKDNYADATAGIFFGYDTDAYKLNIGNASKSLKWDGSEIIATGAWIDTANIVDLAVETIKIKDQAITIPVNAFSSTGTRVYSGDGATNIISAAITSTGAPIQVIIGLNATYPWSPAPEIKYKIYIRRDAVDIYQCDTVFDLDSDERQVITIAMADTPGSGAHTYYIRVLLDSNGIDFYNKSILLLETKK